MALAPRGRLLETMTAIRLIALALTAVMLAALVRMLKHWQGTVGEYVHLASVLVGIAVGLACLWRGPHFASKIATLLGHPVQAGHCQPTRTQWFLLGLLAVAVIVAVICSR